MKSICGVNCDECQYAKNLKCEGCAKSNGCPFGKECFIAKYIKIGGLEKYNEFKTKLIEEFNELNIPGMPKITELVPLTGEFINLEYILPNGQMVKFLEDNAIYLGMQVENEFSDKEYKKCFGLVASLDFIMVSEYGEDGTSPELIIYKKR